MDINYAIKAIEYRPDRPLTDEFNAILSQPTVSTPLLLTVLDFVKENYQSLPDNYMGHVFAIFLLAQLREEKAFPKIIELLATMGDESYEHHVFQDEIDSMPNILASTFNGNLTLLKQLVETTSVYEFARLAALETYLVLWQYHKITREQLIAHFKSFLTNKAIQEGNNDMLYWVIEAAMCFYPEELLNDIRMAFYFQFDEALWREEDCLTAQQFETDFAKGKAFVLKKYAEGRHFHLIDNIEAEMSDWSIFKPEKSWPPKPAVPVIETEKSPEFELISQPDLLENGESEEEKEKTYQAWFKATYGDINPRGLEELQQEYESYSLLRAVEAIDQVRYQIDRIREEMLKLHGPIFEMVEGGTNGGHYDVNEDGEVWDMAMSLDWQLDECIAFLKNAKKALEPLEKLTPQED